MKDLTIIQSYIDNNKLSLEEQMSLFNDNVNLTYKLKLNELDDRDVEKLIRSKNIKFIVGLDDKSMRLYNKHKNNNSFIVNNIVDFIEKDVEYNNVINRIEDEDDFLKELKNDDVSMNMKDLFEHSIQRQYHEIIKYLLQDNKVNLKDKEIVNIIHKNTIDLDQVLDLLIEYGFDINSQDDDGNSLLINNIEEDNGLLSFYFLDEGVDPNIQNNEGNNALMYALKSDSWIINDIFKRLIDETDLNAVNKKGEEALWIAQYSNKRDLVDQILNKL